jgi:hypothetical protein
MFLKGFYHHKDVVVGGPQNVETPYHEGALVLKYRFNPYTNWCTTGFLDFLKIIL